MNPCLLNFPNLHSEIDTFLVVQWLRLRTRNAGGPGAVHGEGTRSHILQPKKKKIPHAATKSRWGQIKINKKCTSLLTVFSCLLVSKKEVSKADLTASDLSLPSWFFSTLHKHSWFSPFCTDHLSILLLLCLYHFLYFQWTVTFSHGLSSLGKTHPLPVNSLQPTRWS